MVKENTHIEVFKLDDLQKNHFYHLNNCLINTIDFVGAFKIETHLILENCIIDNLLIHSCWFHNGIILKNCIIKKYVDYQMGGHNTKPIILNGNIFVEFVNFFDCQFQDIIEMQNNVFVKGTNLFGNKGEGFENSFEKGWLVNENVGKLDLDLV